MNAGNQKLHNGIHLEQGVLAIATMVELENADQGRGCVNFFLFTFLQISHTAETRLFASSSNAYTFHFPLGQQGGRGQRVKPWQGQGQEEERRTPATKQTGGGKMFQL